MRVAVSGSTGLVGSEVVTVLSAAGHEVVRLVRHASRPGGEGRPVGPGEAGGRCGGARGPRRRSPSGGGEHRVWTVEHRPEGRHPRQPCERDALSLRRARGARPAAEDVRVRLRGRLLRRPGRGTVDRGCSPRHGISRRGLSGVGGGLRAGRAEGNPGRGIADRDGPLTEGRSARADAPALPGGARGRDRRWASVRQLGRPRRSSAHHPPRVAVRRS